MIREGTHEDVPELITLGLPHVSRLPGPPKTPNVEALDHFFRQFIDWPNGALFVCEDDGIAGFISGIVMHHPFDGQTCAMKCAWVCEKPGTGGFLLRRFMRWAKEQGANRMAVSRSHMDFQLGNGLRQLGFVPVELSYERAL